MTKEKMIEATRDFHQRKVQDRVEKPKDSLLETMLLFDREDKIEYIAIAPVKGTNLQEFLRNIRTMVQVTILLEGVVAKVHVADAFRALVDTPELQARINKLAKTDPNYLETAEKEGWLKNEDAIIATGESAWGNIRIVQPYRIVANKVVLEPKEEYLDRPFGLTPFAGFNWPKVN